MSERAAHFYNVFRETEDGIIHIRPVELERAPDIGECYEDHDSQTLYMIVRFLNLDGEINLVVRPTTEKPWKLLKNFI